MKRLILAAVVVATSAEAQQAYENTIKCGTFLELSEGRIAVDPQLSGFIRGYLTGVIEGVGVNAQDAMKDLEDVCKENPTLTMRLAVRGAKSGWQ